MHFTSHKRRRAPTVIIVSLIDVLLVVLIFLMISNHFPTATYGQSYSWLILSALVLAGAVAAKFIYKP